MKIPYRFSLLFLITVILSTPQPIQSNTNPDYPCKPPQYNSYTFCNTSLSISTRAKSLISLLTLTEKINQLSNTASSIPRLGIPSYEWWSESLHGIATNGPGVSFNGSIPSATGFPQVLLTSASFNRSLWYKIGYALSVEARAMYNSGQAGLTFWAPNINIFRDPRWGRGQETPGEDPMVVSDYGVEYIKGFQGDGQNELRVSACCKHFTAYDLESWRNYSRYSFNAVVSEQDLKDTYQPPFKSCIQDGKASCLMCSYNQVNGIPACANEGLLQQARTEWGFQGYITSDCDAVGTIYEYQHYVQSPEDAVAVALKAGTDINCGSFLVRNTQSAIEQGKIKEEDVDKALFNLFLVQLRLGLFDGNPIKGKYGKLGPHNVCTTEHKKLALDAARQGIVLLKNDNKFLPLKRHSISSLAVIGPMANDTSKLGGGYTGIPCKPKSFTDGFQAYEVNTTFVSGCLDISCSSTDGFAEAVQIAKEADVVIAILGLDLSQETEDHDRLSLLLPGKQMDLIDVVSKVSRRPLVLVLTGGGPLDVTFAKEDPRIASILWVGYPGEAGGESLAEIIFGDFNPGGRLPITWYPESFTSVPMNDMSMRADPSRGYPGRTYRFYSGDEVYGFGHGLSYTNYTYKFVTAPNRISLSGSTIKADSGKDKPSQKSDGLDYVHIDELMSCHDINFNVKLSVINNGDMDGSHVLLLFSRSQRKLKGAANRNLIFYDRVHTKSNEETEINILIEPCRHLGIVNEQGHNVLPLGNHILMLEGLEHSILIDT
ncbi:hypothetical protein MKW94_028992 [Papaver nudicaule]|uniref:Fibronectin type III-like domain-containing protein n=1 Tax=Papaver nudicaule TaxID=74823 RepID=A0AA41VXY9_PAPNU|nr:hypothetical protein [Papaver nudicaule]